MNYLSSIFLLLFLAKGTYAQQTFTLDESIDHALEHHPALTQTGIAIAQTDVRLGQAKNNLLPNVNIGVSHNYSLGSTIDPSTNSRAPLNIQSNQFYLHSEVDLFDWSKYVSISLRTSELHGARQQYEVTKQQITLNVIRDFYQHQYDKAWLEVLESQIQGIEDQIHRTVKEVEIGTRSKSDIYDIKANMGNIRQAWVNAKNQTEVSRNNLLITMNLPHTDVDFIIDREIQPVNLSAKMADDFVDSQPIMKSYTIQLQQEDSRIKLANSARLPSLYASYQWSTFYSKELNGENNTDFGTQFDENKNQLIGLVLSIPVFNRRQIHAETQFAKLNKENILAEKEKARLELLQTLYNIQSNYQFALENYQLITENFENQRLSYIRSEEKYKEGLIDSYTFFVVRNNWLDANFNLIKSKYEVMMQQDLLEVFGGN